jgi:DNA-nicking Smr family endonuclease
MVLPVAGRRLGADERALWARVIASVTPLEGRQPVTDDQANSGPVPRAAPPAAPKVTAPPPPPPPPPPPAQRVGVKPSETLDGGWDRRIRRGGLVPDMTVDLHGHTLDSAWAMLDASLTRAAAADARVILLITGKPPREGRSGRGAIRGAMDNWLAHSRHAGSIAAVRNAHPRHGGSGALYIVLRRRRGAS